MQPENSLAPPGPCLPGGGRVAVLHARIAFWATALVLLFVRLALAAPFWRSGRTKIAEGQWFTLSDTTYMLFREDYAGVPFPAELGAVLATIIEHGVPILLLMGLATRAGALILIGMTLVIQIFVYPDAWWTVHAQWIALGLVLVRWGGGAFSVDAQIYALSPARRGRQSR